VERKDCSLDRLRVNDRLIISVPAARKLLGKDALGLSDADISNLIVELSFLTMLMLESKIL
jgi:hypothetical protein